MKRPVLPFVALYLAVALVSWAPATSASTHLGPDDRSDVSSLTVPGDNFFPESIAATPAGTLFVGSVVTGEILRFRPGSTTAESLVPADVNAGTVGLFADIVRGVLWACAVDLSFRGRRRSGLLICGPGRCERPMRCRIGVSAPTSPWRTATSTSPIPRIRPRRHACPDGSCG
jgi:hypothetical protein